MGQTLKVDSITQFDKVLAVLDAGNDEFKGIVKLLSEASGRPIPSKPTN